MDQVLWYQTGMEPTEIQHLHAFALLRPLFKNNNTHLELHGSLFVTSTQWVKYYVSVKRVKSALTMEWNRFIGSETFYVSCCFFVTGSALCCGKELGKLQGCRFLQRIDCLFCELGITYNGNKTADHRVGYLTYLKGSPFVSHYLARGWLVCISPFSSSLYCKKNNSWLKGLK